MTLTEENYLKAFYRLSLANEEITVKNVAVELDIKMSTVNSMVKNLSKMSHSICKTNTNIFSQICTKCWIMRHPQRIFKHCASPTNDIHFPPVLKLFYEPSTLLFHACKQRAA